VKVLVLRVFPISASRRASAEKVANWLGGTLQHTVRAHGVVIDAPRFDQRLASATLANHCSFRHSSRNLPLKLSTNAFSIGLPGRIKRSWTRARNN
jgi:hypothetical protein